MKNVSFLSFLQYTTMYLDEKNLDDFSFWIIPNLTVQILLEFSQQIVEGYEFVFIRQSFAEKDPFSQPNSVAHCGA